MYCWNRNCRGFPLNNFRTCGVCVNDSNNQCWRKLNCVLTIPHYWITVRIYFLWWRKQESCDTNVLRRWYDITPEWADALSWCELHREVFRTDHKKLQFYQNWNGRKFEDIHFFTVNEASPDVGEAVQVVRLDKKSTAVYHQHINGKKWLWSSTRVTLVKRTEMGQWLSLDWLHIRQVRIRTEVSVR